MIYKTGHLPDHPEVVRRRLGLHLHPQAGVLRSIAASLPMATTNRARMDPAKGGPGILWQSDIQGCEGYANASGGTLFLAGQGRSVGLISPVLLYLGALLVDRVLQPDGALSPVTDTGTMPSSVLTAWQTFGTLLATDDDQYPASSATLYLDPNNPASELRLPSLEKLYGGSAYRFTGAYFVTSRGPQRLLDALTVLASGRPITDAIPASGQDFQGYSGGVVGALSGPIDHANLIVDYTWLGSAAEWLSFVTALQQGAVSAVAALVHFLILHGVNSWGEAWGESDSVSGMRGGMYRANIDHFDQAEDLCVLDLSAL